MDPITGALIVGGIGAGMNFFGQRSANQANAREAQKNRDFQERMSNSAYQRAVADMRAAGVNPALALSRGGASTPGGATSAPQQNTAAGAASGMQAGSQIMLNSAQARNAEASAQLQIAQAATEASKNTGEKYRNVYQQMLNVLKENELTYLLGDPNSTAASAKETPFYKRQDAKTRMEQFSALIAENTHLLNRSNAEVQEMTREWPPWARQLFFIARQLISGSANVSFSPGRN